MPVEVFHVNAFTDVPEGGNPAGVAPVGGEGLSDAEMQAVAKAVGFSETAFVLPSERADFRVRFFTPEGEVDLCGHATIATFSLLHALGRLAPGRYTQETLAGVLDVEVQADGRIFMTQTPPVFGDILDAAAIAESLRIPVDALLPNLPVQIVSTGLPDIIVPIRDLKTLHALQPDFEAVSVLSKTHGVIGMHLFTLETLHEATAHCRNLAPLVGIPEEAATGTASGATACYLLRHGLINPTQAANLRFEQGHRMNRPSQILATLSVSGNTITHVRVGGMATAIGTLSI